ncbi:MAG: TlpA family protein disulfide reductase [Planctomycetes bacterium]|nr:TlpA family protein disulfide reductase [Planctomycetota bacterium]
MRFLPRCIWPLTLCVAFLSSTAVAQGSFQELLAEFAKRREAAAAATDGMLTYEDHTRITNWFAGQLEKYVKASEGATDHAQASLELASMRLRLGEPDAARTVLKSLKPASATMDDAFVAAELAERLGLASDRIAWIDAALAKAKTFEQRMRAGTILMTRMVEPERANQLYEDALRSADDDEQKAEVRWWQAVAVREREDRADGDYEKALHRIVTEFPGTRFGKIAADRLRAMAFSLGDPTVDLVGTGLDGKPLRSADLRGKVVAVYFWSTRSERALEGLKALRSLRERYADAGFEVFGVCLDEDRKAVDDYLARNAHPWRDLFDGKGYDGDHARRLNVEFVPHLFLVDRDGKIAGLRLYVDDAEEVDHTREFIERTLGAK